ncbi:MAG: transglutaminase family protein [Bradymonadales bacterium]|nr:transglutaminase family protein [Bradymonadales bacterium]
MDEAIWTTRDEALRLEFAHQVARCESTSIARLALQVAAGEYPELLVDLVLDRLEKMARDIRSRLSKNASDGEKIAGLNDYLFNTVCLRGEPSDYYDPKSSYLNEVLTRRCGLPISLCIIYLDVASRLGLPMVGVGLPGHFIVRYTGGGAVGEIFVDPYNNGEMLSRQDCKDLVRRLTSGRLPWHDDFLQGVDNRHIITRLLNNLKSAYLRLADPRRELRIQNYILVVYPDEPHEIRERGLILWRLQSFKGALEDLKRYLKLAPQALDGEEIRQKIAMLTEKVKGLC